MKVRVSYEMPNDEETATRMAELSAQINRQLDRAVFKGISIRGSEAKLVFEKDGRAFDLRIGNDGAPGVYVISSERR